MQSGPPIGDDLFPPFEGFPKEGIAFLQKLKKNNNRPWFQKHKEDYEQLVKFPMQCLIASLAQKLADDAPEILFNPRKSIFRIYRDVRFSKNKSPYKTNIAAYFDLRGKKSPGDAPGLYVGIEPGEIFIGGGLYMPGGDQLKAIRRSIAEHPDEFLEIVQDRTFKRSFGEIMGEKLQKAPLGYPKDHPMIDYLRYKQFFVGTESGHEPCFRAGFADTAAQVFRDAMPFVRWLTRATSGR
jgi:uncharacterized protein (TIGR02453 family)